MERRISARWIPRLLAARAPPAIWKVRPIRCTGRRVRYSTQDKSNWPSSSTSSVSGAEKDWGTPPPRFFVTAHFKGLTGATLGSVENKRFIWDRLRLKPGKTRCCFGSVADKGVRLELRTERFATQNYQY